MSGTGVPGGPGPPRPSWPALPVGTLFDRRYRVLHVLGQGGCGTVYRVRDEVEAGGQELALKTLHPGLSNESVSRGFEMEFALLARLRHPNLVRVDRFAVAAGDVPTRYFIAELVAGPDLRHAAQLGGLAALVLLARAVLLGLDHLHRHGYVHQDVKPGNVLVAGVDDPAGPSAWVPKLTDLGIAQVAGQDAGDNITGTVAYLSPERLAGAPADPLGDLWSLGMTLWACAARRPPVPNKVDDATRWLRTNQIPPLRDVAPDAPVELERLVAGLCARDPRNRLASAEEALEAVERLLAGAGGAEPAPTAARVENAALVGRDDVLAAGAAVLAARRTPAPRGFLLRGPSGSGRSRVLAEIAVRVQVAGARLVEVEVAAGLRPWIGALRQLDVGQTTYVKSAEGIADALARALAASPAVLLCDDLSARDALADHLLRRLAAALSVRAVPHPGGLLAATDVPVGRDPDPDPAGFVQRTLEPLRPSDLAALVASAFGAGVPLALAELVTRESGGNPGLAIAVLRTLLDAGAVRRVGGSWALDAALAAATLQAGRRDRRLDALDAVPRALLAALALFGPAGARVALPVARAAAALEPGPFHAALETLRAGGLVRTTRENASASPGSGPGGALPAQRVAHTSEAIRAHCAEGVDPAARRDVHARALAALTAAGEDDPAALCLHARGAGRAADALHLALRAAEDALARRDGPAALAAADLALSAWADVPTAPAFGRVGMRLRAQALLLLGRLSDADAVADRVCQEDPSDARVALVRAEIAVAVGEAAAITHAMEHAHALLDAGGDRWPDDEARLDAMAALAALDAEAAAIVATPHAARAAAGRALATLPAQRVLERARAHAVLGEAAVQLGDRARGLREFETVLELREASGDDQGIADALMRLAMHADLEGDPDRGHALVSRGLEHAERAGAQASIARLLNLRGILLMWAGRSRDAAEALVEAERRGHLSGFSRVISTAAGNRLVVHQQEGLYGQAIGAAARSWANKRRQGDEIGIAATLINLSTLYLMMGDQRVGAGYARRARAAAARRGLPTIHANAVLCTAWADVASGRPHDALALLERIRGGHVAPLASVRNEGDAAVVRGRAYLALGRTAETVEALEEAKVFRAGWSFKLAQLYMVRAEAMGEHGEQDLRSAIDVAVHAGALAIEWEARARLALLVRARGDEPGARRELMRASEPLRAVLADLPRRLRTRYCLRSPFAALIEEVRVATRTPAPASSDDPGAPGGAPAGAAVDAAAHTRAAELDDPDAAPTTLSPRR